MISNDPTEPSPDNQMAASLTPGHVAFPYEFRAELSASLPVESEGVIIDGTFRHFNASAIAIGVSGYRGSLNLGYRLCRNSGKDVIFEDRATFSHTSVEAGQWVNCQLRIPGSAVEYEIEHQLIVDLVYEDLFWFSNKNSIQQSFCVSFSDANAVRRRHIEDLQLPMLEGNLASAFSRIAVLEHSERVLRAERDDYRTRYERVAERLNGTIEIYGLLPPPAARIADIVRGMNAVERRDRWLSELNKIGIKGELFGLFPHDGGRGPLQVLVHGSGGYGDMIYLGVVVREMHDYFGHCDIFVMHEHTRVDSIYGANPYVTAAFCLNHSDRSKFLPLVNSMDVFDLVVEVKYATTYSFPPLSRVPMSFQQRAIFSSAEWQKYVRHDWPHANNHFANAVTARGLNKLDLVGLTSLLPISRHSDIDFFIDEASMQIFPSLVGKRYVTMHHGADRAMGNAPGLQTKNLSTTAWVSIVRALRQDGFFVVQMGEQHEIFITGVDLDLRGQTTLAATAFVIKCASAHIDTEGGLVHVARAVNTPSVVAFGPTPVAFFGYPQNENIPPRMCGNCWWLTKRWAAECPRGLENPECMESHNPAMIAERCIAISARSQTATIELIENLGGCSDPLELLKQRQEIRELTGNGIVLIGTEQDRIEALDFAVEHLSGATVLVEMSHFRSLRRDYDAHIAVKPYSLGNLSFASGSFDWSLGLGLDVRNEKGLQLALDLARCVKDSGRCIIHGSNLAQPIPASDWISHIVEAGKRLQGRRFEVDATSIPPPDLTNHILFDLKLFHA